MNKIIKYIGYYDVLGKNLPIRNYSLAEAKKMDYIINSLNYIGYDVEVISMACSNQKGVGIVPTEYKIVNEKTKLILPPSLKVRTKIGRALRYYMSHIWMFCFLLSHCKRNEKLLVYHNYGYAFPLILAKTLLKLNIILQVEEIYAKVWNLSKLDIFREKLLLKEANRSCLIVSEVLAEYLAIDRPVISYGNYSVYSGMVEEKGKGGAISLLFSGSIDTERNGGFLSVKSMCYLPNIFRLYISGPIAKKDEQSFMELVNDTNRKLGRDAVMYLGVLPDDQYIDLLLSTDIALNPQKEGSFDGFVFPSKILTYLSYELPVVTTKGESIVKSSIADLLFFSKGFSPQEIAVAIQSVTFNKDMWKYRTRLKKLDAEFCDGLSTLLETL